MFCSLFWFFLFINLANLICSNYVENVCLKNAGVLVSFDSNTMYKMLRFELLNSICRVNAEPRYMMLSIILILRLLSFAILMLRDISASIYFRRFQWVISVWKGKRLSISGSTPGLKTLIPGPKTLTPGLKT